MPPTEAFFSTPDGKVWAGAASVNRTVAARAKRGLRLMMSFEYNKTTACGGALPRPSICAPRSPSAKLAFHALTPAVAVPRPDFARIPAGQQSAAERSAGLQHRVASVQCRQGQGAMAAGAAGGIPGESAPGI